MSTLVIYLQTVFPFAPCGAEMDIRKLLAAAYPINMGKWWRYY